MDVPTMLEIFESYGFETDDEMTEERKVEALNETYWDACSRQAWPFLEVWASAKSNDGGLLTSNDSHTEVRQVITLTDITGRRTLVPSRLDDLIENVLTPDGAAFAPATPLYYYFSDDGISVYPIPPDPNTRTFFMVYIFVPAELTATTIEADIEFPKRYHRSVLVMGTLSRLAVMQDDTELGAAYERLYEKALAMMVEDVFKQQSQRPDYVHVNDPDNWDYS